MTNNNLGSQLKLEDAVIPANLAVTAMRDGGYKSTAYALAELIDNSIQAKASHVEVFCTENESEVNGKDLLRINEIAVLDNGVGMDSSVLKQALQFGNGTRLNDRSGIGRFGMGLPNSSISQCRKVQVWTWQAGADNAVYSYLDIDAMETGAMLTVPIPRPEPVPTIWKDWSDNFGPTGTLVVWSNFDQNRLTWKRARALIDNTEALIGRIYRYFINDGSANIRFIAETDGETTIERSALPNDPMYLMDSSTTPSPFNHVAMFEHWGDQDFTIPLNGEEHTVTVRASYAKKTTVPEQGGPGGQNRGNHPYGKHASKNQGVSIVRAHREIELDPAWVNSYDPVERWWGIEVHFPPSLDEIFGVTNDKQSATVMARMPNFDWKEESENEEDYMDFRKRLMEYEDPRYHLMEIQTYIRDQVGEMRKVLTAQTKGMRSGNKQRHEDPGIDDEATKQWKDRADSGYKAEGDDQVFDIPAEKDLLIHLVEEDQYPEKVAEDIVAAVKARDRKLIFVTANDDSPAFFRADSRPGGVTELVLNSNHPVFDQLIKVLDEDLTNSTSADLIERVNNASDTFKLILAAWARYEQEDVPARAQNRKVRHEWGQMTETFLQDRS